MLYAVHVLYSPGAGGTKDGLVNPIDGLSAGFRRSDWVGSRL